jgi:hypothetical protein
MTLHVFILITMARAYTREAAFFAAAMTLHLASSLVYFIRNE